ncbi:MAG: SsrA-binding protein SmpB [Nitrospinota bacterium]|nr:SsrA-binding protein SmpB [Nitrospinota bacterium]
MSRKEHSGSAEKKRAAATPSIQNRKARHDYHILESLEAGIALKGCEVKSIREGKIQIHDSYVRIKDGEAWLVGCHISPYKNLNTFEEYYPDRERKLLMHRRQIAKLYSQIKEKGLTLLPLKLYFARGKVKLEVGLGKGKRLYDKREDMKTKEANREMDRGMKGR